MARPIEEIEGIGPAYAEKLGAKLVEVNEQKKRVRQVPPPSAVTGWVQQAGELPPKVEY